MENKRRHWLKTCRDEQRRFNGLVGRLRVYVSVTVNALLFLDPGLIRAMDACGDPRMQCC